MVCLVVVDELGERERLATQAGVADTLLVEIRLQVLEREREVEDLEVALADLAEASEGSVASAAPLATIEPPNTPALRRNAARVSLSTRSALSRNAPSTSSCSRVIPASDLGKALSLLIH
ncbi:MAG: hypothetical protein ACR2K9_01380 [Solirubrobacteraceae bacterium]